MLTTFFLTAIAAIIGNGSESFLFSDDKNRKNFFKDMSYINCVNQLTVKLAFNPNLANFIIKILQKDAKCREMTLEMCDFRFE